MLESFTLRVEVPERYTLARTFLSHARNVRMFHAPSPMRERFILRLEILERFILWLEMFERFIIWLEML